LVVNESPQPPFDKGGIAEAIYDEFDEVSGVCVNYNPKRTNVILGEKTECLAGADFVEEKIFDRTFKIGSGTFFQVNPRSAENIFEYVKKTLTRPSARPLAGTLSQRERGGLLVLDAYAGISAFGASVANVCEKVVSVEENAEACERARDLKIENLEIHNMDAAEFFKKEKRLFDAIILDPPRKGCTKESLDEIKRLLKPDGRIIYVSCNPATLARDIKYLQSPRRDAAPPFDKGGLAIESVRPFDLFCHTYHVETVAVLSDS
jgi:23S rRNA (uracil1939-C5)-methyltransferase